MSFVGTDGAQTGAAEPDDGGGVHRRLLGGLLVKQIRHHVTDPHPSRRENREGLKSGSDKQHDFPSVSSMGNKSPKTRTLYPSLDDSVRVFEESNCKLW